MDQATSEQFNAEPILAILFVSIMLLTIGIFMFVMVLVYQKKKMRTMQQQEEIRSNYMRSVLKAKVEIREETLKYVGQELHDNIGQVLSLVKLYLSKPTVKPSTDIKSLIEQAITDIRELSQNLNISRIENYSLSEFIEQEVHKINKVSGLTAVFENDCQCEIPDMQSRLMIGRIFQESINNIIKHAEASNIIIKLALENNHCILSIADNGKGFNMGKQSGGSGLSNIHDRARLIGGSAQILSISGEGTVVKLTIPLNT